MPLKSMKTHVVFRAECHEAQRFLLIIKPALLSLTGSSGVVCREDKHRDTLYDVRAPVVPEVAFAIYGLICERGMGREDVTEEMVVSYLEEMKGKPCQ